MTVTSMHEDVPLDTQEYYKWETDFADAYVDTLQEALRALEMTEWKYKYRIDWDARMSEMEELSEQFDKSWWR